jgi:hypothetical protein
VLLRRRRDRLGNSATPGVSASRLGPLLNGSPFPEFPCSRLQSLGGFTPAAARLNAAVSCAGFGSPLALDARPVLSALRTKVRHRAMSRSATNGSYCFAGDVTHSGSPALRRPSIYIRSFEEPVWATHSAMRKLGSSSSRWVTASFVSASRPRWAKATARQR